HWDGTRETEDRVQQETKATIRCIPFNRKKEPGQCIVTGKPSEGRGVFAKAYLTLEGAVKTLTVRVADALAARVTGGAREGQGHRAAFIREALEAYLESDTAPFISCYDLAPHLAGCLDGGPGDLAHNPKHMEGFGR